MLLLIYRTPLVSFLYERGWRQNFIWGGFPGPEKEVTTGKNSLFFFKREFSFMLYAHEASNNTVNIVFDSLKWLKTT